MIDRKKVISGLEFTKAMITFNPLTGEDIEPGNLNEENKTTYDACVGAIALLKDQEPVKPVNVRWEMGINGGNCPKCMNWVQRTYNYCPFCGKEVKWDA